MITGTGRGMGRQVALRFVAEGASVVGCDIDRRRRLRRLGREGQARAADIAAYAPSMAEMSVADHWET